MIDPKSIQRAIATMTFYESIFDGIIGVSEITAIKAIFDKQGIKYSTWSTKRLITAFEQLIMRNAGIVVGDIDGLIGPQTLHALEQWQDHLRTIPGVDAPHGKAAKWPTQANVPGFYGKMGSNQTLLKPPYPLYLYDTRTEVPGISVHTKVAGSVERILSKVLDIYGPVRIRSLHLDRFFGSLAVRQMRGSNAWSMHSWGIALDFDATRNQLRWGRDKAAFAKPEYEDWWKAWEAEGWTSLGRQRNYDWMHVQAASL